jgi:hypothetical protein
MNRYIMIKLTDRMNMNAANNSRKFVIPAEAGIQCLQTIRGNKSLDSCLRRNDDGIQKFWGI